MHGLLDDTAGVAHVEAHVALASLAEHRTLIHGRSGLVAEQAYHLVVESGLRLDGHDAGNVLAAVLFCETQSITFLIIVRQCTWLHHVCQRLLKMRQLDIFL